MKKHFHLNQNVLWITNNDEFEGKKTVIKAIITKAGDTRCYARTCGNNDNTDDMNLIIDEDNEMEFFDTSLQEQIYGMKL